MEEDDEVGTVVVVVEVFRNLALAIWSMKPPPPLLTPPVLDDVSLLGKVAGSVVPPAAGGSTEVFFSLA